MVRSCLPPTPPVTVLLAAALALCLGAAVTIGQDGAQPRRASIALEEAFRYIRDRVPLATDTVVLAAQGTKEGHWRFVNRSGEMFTVGTADEMKRVVTVLDPEAKAGARLVLYLTEDTALARSGRLRPLRPDAEKHIVLGDKSYPLPRRTQPTYAVVRPNLGLEIDGNPQRLKEALRHLDRPLRTAGVRLLALEAGDTKTPPASPGADAGKGAPVERIDPKDLGAAFARVSGQTLVVCARGEGDLIYIKPAAGPERGIPVGNLLAAANKADVALIVLVFASTPQQPADGTALCPHGGKPASEVTLADILDAAAVQSRRAPVAVALAGGRKVLDAMVVGDIAAGAEPTFWLRDARKSDPGWSLVGEFAVPVLAGYAALLALGLLGTPEARKWGKWLWPPEEMLSQPEIEKQKAENGKARKRKTNDKHAGPPGYLAARAMRFLAFSLFFLPLTAVVAMPYSLFKQIRNAIENPGGIWRWSKKRHTGRGAGQAEGKGSKEPVAAQ